METTTPTTTPTQSPAKKPSTVRRRRTRVVCVPRSKARQQRFQELLEATPCTPEACMPEIPVTRGIKNFMDVAPGCWVCGKRQCCNKTVFTCKCTGTMSSVVNELRRVPWSVQLRAALLETDDIDVPSRGEDTHWCQTCFVEHLGGKAV